MNGFIVSDVLTAMQRKYYSQSKILSSLGVFSVLALLHSGQRSAATLPSIQLSQGEKSIPNLIIFYTENSMKSAEALVRWIRADGSVVLPDQFLPSMEQTGAVTMLDWYVV